MAVAVVGDKRTHLQKVKQRIDALKVEKQLLEERLQSMQHEAHVKTLPSLSFNPEAMESSQCKQSPAQDGSAMWMTSLRNAVPSSRGSIAWDDVEDISE